MQLTNYIYLQKNTHHKHIYILHIDKDYIVPECLIYYSRIFRARLEIKVSKPMQQIIPNHNKTTIIS